MRNASFWRPVIVSLLVTPVCLLLGIGSAGGGHGDYVLARILFPYALLPAVLFDAGGVPLVLLAVLQYPLYGLILGAAARRGRFLPAFGVLTAAHALLATACFLKPGGSFS